MSEEKFDLHITLIGKGKSGKGSYDLCKCGVTNYTGAEIEHIFRDGAAYILFPVLFDALLDED